MPTVVITGANRGLGLEFSRQYSEDGWTVVATCRAPDRAEALRALDVEILPLETTSPAAAARLAATLKERPIDLLLNNAGVMGERAASALDADLAEWEAAFRINVLGPAIVTRALLPNLELAEAPVAATLGSQAGVFSKMNSADMAIYRSTKAAAHAATISLAHALRERGVLYLSLRPGPTKTDMTGDTARYDVDDSVRLLRGVLAQATPRWAGCFVDRSARIFPYNGDFEE